MLHLLLAALLLAQSSTNDYPDDWVSMPADYMESNPETVYELMHNDDAVMEGDIMLSSDRNAANSIWPAPAVPYEIHPELASRTNDILAAMAMLSSPTCLTFPKRTSESNYLLFEVGTGCASFVGFAGGVQSVFIGPACTVGNIAHEVLHALGLYHEHTRGDRDKYISISPENIMQGMQKNFNVQQGKTFEQDYDAGSIMHYGRWVQKKTKDNRGGNKKVGLNVPVGDACITACNGGQVSTNKRDKYTNTHHSILIPAPPTVATRGPNNTGRKNH